MASVTDDLIAEHQRLGQLVPLLERRSMLSEAQAAANVLAGAISRRLDWGRRGFLWS